MCPQRLNFDGDVCARSTSERRLERVVRGDDRFTTAGLHEPQGGLDLRTHRARWEVAGGGVATQVITGDVVEATGVRRAEIKIDAVDVGRHNEPIDLQSHGEQRRREILIDDRLDARESITVSHDRNAAATERDDGLLTASEVTSLRMDADWVGLSACNTASGDGLGGDAFSGLARSFFYAGTRALLVSHWYVDNDTTVRLVTETFRALKNNPGIGRAEALRQGMRTLIADGKSHPQLWAPFVIIGEVTCPVSSDHF